MTSPLDLGLSAEAAGAVDSLLDHAVGIAVKAHKAGRNRASGRSGWLASERRKLAAAVHQLEALVTADSARTGATHEVVIERLRAEVRHRLDAAAAQLGTAEEGTTP